MGYTTEFKGRFLLNKPLEKDHYDYLVKFNETRRMARDLSRLPKTPELNKNFGIDGEFYVDGTGDFGQDHDASIIDYNKPPVTQPGLWCHWRPTKDRKGFEWDGTEKFYRYREWMKYILKNFLIPKEYDIVGKVHYQGEDADDQGDLDGAKLTAEVLSEMDPANKIQTVPPPPAPVAPPNDGMTVLKPRKIRLDP
jgi:hypothetical protein